MNQLTWHFGWGIFIKFVVSGIFIVPFFVWVLTIGELNELVAFELPDGQILYLMSKLLGLYAITLLWFQIILKLLKKNILRLDIKINISHKVLGLISFVVIVLHLATFIAAVTLRSGGNHLDLLLLHFDKGFYKQMVSLGALAFWLTLVVIYIGITRARQISKRSNTKLTTVLHKLSFVVFGLAFVHGITIGSESRNLIMASFYLFYGISIFILVVFKFSSFIKESNALRATND